MDIRQGSDIARDLELDVPRLRIFSFGNVGAGKSTLLACLISRFMQAAGATWVMDADDLDGRRMIKNLVTSIKANRFPGPTPPQVVVTARAGLVGRGQKFPVLIHEMSGEKLQKVAIEHGGIFPEDVLAALRASDLVLALTAVDDIEKDGHLIGEFLNQLYNLRLKFPVGLVVTKCDRRWPLDGDRALKHSSLEQEVFKLAESHLQWAMSFLRMGGLFKAPQLFAFSVGEVDEQDGVITKLQPKGLDRIAEWVMQNVKQ